MRNTIEITLSEKIQTENINQTWKGIDILPSNNPSTRTFKEYNNTNYTTPADDIGNALNSHFIESGPKLPSQLPYMYNVLPQ